MKERPIRFSGPMVRALLDGTKTQTRRVVKKQPPSWIGSDLPGLRAFKLQRCPYGNPGDLLWVREAWSTCGLYDKKSPSEMAPHWLGTIRYLASGEKSGRTRASMHMPRWACRLLLEIVSVRLERLQDISEDDARAEGCAGGHSAIPLYGYSATPNEHFSALWSSINGTDSWNANPWVWVVEFRRA